MKPGHLETVKHVGEDCFVSPVVITVKSDKSVKMALDSRILNDSCIKVRPHMPNMEELLNQILVEITKDRTKELRITKIDLDYAYGQMMLSEETSRQCVFAITGGNFSGYSKRGFTVQRHTHSLPRKIRQDIGILHTGVVRRYNSGHTRKPRRPRKEIIRCTGKIGKRRIRSKREKIRILEK